MDSSVNLYVVGSTNSNDFPTIVAAFDSTFNGGTDVFVTKMSATGSSLVYSTYLGGTGTEFGNVRTL